MDLTSYQISKICDWPRSSVSDSLRRLGIEKENRVANSPPFGKELRDGVLTSIPSEQRIIKKMIHLRKTGESYRSIAAHLNELKLPTKTGKNGTNIPSTKF